MLAVGNPRSRPRWSPLHHRAGGEPRIAEQLGRLDHAPVGERGADRGRRDRPALVLERRRGLDREAVALALLGEERRRAAPLMAEMKIEPDGRAADAEPADQDARDELLRASARRMPASKVSTSAPVRPVAASRRSFDRASVRRNTGSDGRSTLRGCGSNVTAIAGAPSAVARAIAASITARWPRCTPSKLPIAATAPLQRGQPGASSCTTRNGSSVGRLGHAANWRARPCRRRRRQVKPGRRRLLRRSRPARRAPRAAWRRGRRAGRACRARIWTAPTRRRWSAGHAHSRRCRAPAGSASVRAACSASWRPFIPPGITTSVNSRSGARPFSTSASASRGVLGGDHLDSRARRSAARCTGAPWDRPRRTGWSPCPSAVRSRAAGAALAAASSTIERGR